MCTRQRSAIREREREKERERGREKERERVRRKRRDREVEKRTEKGGIKRIKVLRRNYKSLIKKSKRIQRWSKVIQRMAGFPIATYHPFGAREHFASLRLRLAVEEKHAQLRQLLFAHFPARLLQLAHNLAERESQQRRAILTELLFDNTRGIATDLLVAGTGRAKRASSDAATPVETSPRQSAFRTVQAETFRPSFQKAGQDPRLLSSRKATRRRLASPSYL